MRNKGGEIVRTSNLPIYHARPLNGNVIHESI
jgi:hypothetical protein